MNSSSLTLASKIAALGNVVSSREGNLKSYIKHKSKTKNPSMLDRYGFAWYLGFDENRRWIPRLNRYGAHSLIIGNDQHDRSLLLNLVASQHYSASPYESLRIVILVPTQNSKNLIRIDHSTEVSGPGSIEEVTLVGTEALIDELRHANSLMTTSETKRALFLIHDIDRFELTPEQRLVVKENLLTITKRSLASFGFNIVMSISNSDGLPEEIVGKVSLISLRVRNAAESIAIIGESGMESVPPQIGAVEVSAGPIPFKIPKSMTSGGFSSVGGNIQVTKRPAMHAPKAGSTVIKGNINE